MSDDTEMVIDNPPTDIPEDKADTSQESEKGKEVRVAFKYYFNFSYRILKPSKIIFYTLDSHGSSKGSNF